MCWQMFMFWFLKSITFENSVRQRERGFGFTLVAWRWCFRQSKPPFRESLLEHTDGSGLTWLSQHSQSERSLIIQPYRQVDRLEVTESWYRRMISNAVSLGNFTRVSSAGVTKEGLLGYQCSHGYKLLGTRGPHLLFLGKKKCVSLWIIMQCSVWNSFSQ